MEAVAAGRNRAARSVVGASLARWLGRFDGAFDVLTQRRAIRRRQVGMRYMQTIQSQPTAATPSAADLAAMRADIEEVRGTERVDSASSRAKGALAIGLLTALISLGLGGRLLDAAPATGGSTPSPEVRPSIAPEVEAVTVLAPLEGDVVRGNVVTVQARASLEHLDVWVVGRLGRLVLGEVRAGLRHGIVTAELPVITPPDSPVTAVDLVIETGDGPRSTVLATQHIVIASRSPVTLASVQVVDGAPALEFAGTAPLGTAVEVSVASSGNTSPDADVTSCRATVDETDLPFGLGHWACRVPTAAPSSGLAIDLHWTSPTGQAGSILFTREGSDPVAGREGS